MTLAEKIWGSSIGAFIAYGKTAAAAALKPLLVTDNGDGTGTLVVSASSSALPTGAATSAKQDTGNNSLSVIENETHLRDLGSAVHLSGNASSQSVAIPSGTRAIFVASTGGVSNLMLNGDAGASTSPIVYQNGYLTYPIDDTDDLYCYAGVGTDTYINFLG